MNEVRQLIAQGGPVMFALLLVSLLLYEACFRMLFSLSRVRRRLSRAGGDLHAATVAELRAAQDALRDRFREDSGVIGAWVAAAPLLGLLGTVMGMINTFETLAAHGTSSSGGLAEGISMALITTETGLAVAIPAVVLVYYAQRQLHRTIQRLIQCEDAAALSAT